MLMARHRFNFTEITERFEEAGCLGMVDAESLTGAAADLLGDPERRRSQGQAAREVVNANRGASDMLLVRLEDILR